MQLHYSLCYNDITFALRFVDYPTISDAKIQHFFEYSKYLLILFKKILCYIHSNDYVHSFTPQKYNDFLNTPNKKY